MIGPVYIIDVAGHRRPIQDDREAQTWYDMAHAVQKITQAQQPTSNAPAVPEQAWFQLVYSRAMCVAGRGEWRCYKCQTDHKYICDFLRKMLLDMMGAS